MTAIKEYLAPQTLEEGTRIAAQTEATILAGGTDLAPRWSKGTVQRPTAILDVKAIDELKGVKRANGRVVSVGACTLMSELEADPIIRAAAPVLAEAAGRIACPQIRNRATLGGNLCNASPAADAAVPLILLDAVVELASCSPEETSATGDGPRPYAVREVPISDFFSGPGSTALRPGEILARVRFKPLSDDRLESRSHRWFGAWDKFGTRPAMEIAVASVGVLLKYEGEVVVRARVAYGSVAPIPLRGRKAEAQLVGRRLSDAVVEECMAVAREEIAPITDVRASAAYRREVVAVMLRRMLEDARRSGRG